MRLLNLPLDRLEPNPWNARRMNRRRLSALGRSIREDGFLQPLVARPLWTAQPVEEGEEPTFVPRTAYLLQPSAACEGLALTEQEWLDAIGANDAEGGKTDEEWAVLVPSFRWQIIGGEQRWRALRDADATHAAVLPHPCDDATARRLTLSLNSEGDDDADAVDLLLRQLVHDYGQDAEDLAGLTGIRAADIIEAAELEPPPDDRDAGVGTGTDLVILSWRVRPETAEEVRGVFRLLRREVGAPHDEAVLLEAARRVRASLDLDA